MDVAAVSFLLTVGFIIILIYVLALWQVFTKAGEDGWKAIIPIYNQYILSKIGNQPVWVFLLLFIPFINIGASLLISLGVAEAFGKSTVVGVLIWLFPYFGYMYLGWGQAEYKAQDQE